MGRTRNEHAVRPLQRVGADDGAVGKMEPNLYGGDVGVKAARRPEQPTAKELDEHELTHTLYRDWCVFCTKGRGVSDRHARQRRADGHEDGMTTWSMGLCVLTDGSAGDKEAANYVLVCHDQKQVVFELTRYDNKELETVK